MKKVRTILCAFGAVALLASTIMSCSKEEGARTDEQNGRGTIAVSVTGCTGEYSQIEDTKSDLISNIRVSWKEGDKVYAYDGENYLGELTVSVKDGSDYYAMLTAESIEEPAGSKIILVHSNAFSEAPDISDGKIVLNMSAQTCSGSVSATPFLAYGTLDYDVPGQKIEGKIAEFKMASSIMRLNCSGLEKSAAIKSARLKGMSNECVLEVSNDGVSVGQGELGDIDMSFASSFAANANGATTIYVAIAKNGTASAQTMELNQTKSFEWNFGSRTRDKATAFNAVCPMTEIIEYYFTVSESSTLDPNAKKIKFAPGNLYCTRTGSEGNWSYSFGFEANQFDFRSNDQSNSYSECVVAVIDGAPCENPLNTSGLFQWVPNSSTASQDSKASFGAFDYTDYQHLKGDDLVDYGKALGEKSPWRTLSRDEWKYLYKVRRVNGETSYGKTCVIAEVNTGVGNNKVKGLIIFYDEYTGPTTGLTSIPEGCAFLPLAGSTFNAGVDGPEWMYVSEVGIKGDYQTTTYSYEYHDPYFFWISNDEEVYIGTMTDFSDAGYGRSVRLVTELE